MRRLPVSAGESPAGAESNRPESDHHPGLLRYALAGQLPGQVTGGDNEVIACVVHQGCPQPGPAVYRSRAISAASSIMRLT